MAPPKNMVQRLSGPGREVSKSKKQRPYKVQTMTITQEKKKLRSILSFHTEPPNGYTFIPAGNPDLTQAMKDCARKENLPIYAVTTTPHARVHDLSKEVHRVGFHFPTPVVAEVCKYYGITLTRSGTIMGEDVQFIRDVRRGGKQGAREHDQAKLNTEARDSIKDLFPNIPDQDLYQIIKTAFQKGDRKVGTANELSLVRRAQLSVVAHIRHIYTNYDRLLKTVGYHDARGKVEGPTLKKLVEWRGDDENNTKAMEDVMKEVVVLTDDEDSGDDAEEMSQLEPQEAGMQMLPNHANEGRLERRPEVQMRLLTPRDLEYNQQSEDEVAAGYSYLPQAPRRRKMVDDRLIDEGQYRRAAWERARAEHRAHPTQLQPVVVLENPSTDRHYHDQAVFNFNDPVELSRKDQAPVQFITHPRLREIEAPTPQKRMSSTLMRGEDGILYERIVEARQVDPERSFMHSRRWPSPGPTDRNGYSSDPISNQSRMPRDHAHQTRVASPRLQEVDNIIVQSIEGPPVSPEGFRRSYPGQFPSSHGDSRVFHAQDGRHELIDLTNSSPQHPIRKRKLNDISSDDIHRGPDSKNHERYQIMRPRVVESTTVLAPRAELRPTLSERVITELPHQSMSHREYPNHAQQPRGALGPRVANHAPEFRDMPSTPLSTSHRAVEISSAPSHLSAFSDSAPLRVQQYPQSFRPLSPSRASFTPLHAVEGQSIRRAYTSTGRETIELVSENRSSNDQWRVVNGPWPSDSVRAFPAERRAEYTNALSHQSRDDQFIRPQMRQPIELVSISRTLSHDGQPVRSRGEYVPVYESPSAVPLRQSLDGVSEDSYRRGEIEYIRVPTLAQGNRRYDQSLQQTYVQN